MFLWSLFSQCFYILLNTINHTTTHTLLTTSNVCLMHSCMLATKSSRCTPWVTHFFYGLWWNFLQFSIHTSCIPLFVYLWYFNYMKCSYRSIRCLSLMTHVATSNFPLRDRARTHVSVPGHSLRRDWIIASTALMIDRTRIFPTAWTQKPTPFVPSVWAPMHTTSMHAKHPGLGTANTPHHPGDTEETYTCERMTLPSAWTGKGFEAAPVPSMTPNTSAQV